MPLRGQGLASPTGVFSWGFGTTAVLGWKRKADSDSGRALMFAERLWAGHGLASPFISFSEARHSRPSFTRPGPGSFWVWWAACGHLKLIKKTHGTQHRALRGTVGAPGPGCEAPLCPSVGQQFQGGRSLQCPRSCWTFVSVPLASY